MCRRPRRTRRAGRSPSLPEGSRMATAARPDPRGHDLDELDLYTIPIHSSWFSWDEIHDTERAALREFFDGSSISRTPKIYKDYRDFIINRYREDPSRRLTFTDVRKALVGDVCLLRKVFLFLEKWGLINFAAPPGRGAGGGGGGEGGDDDDGGARRGTVVVEDGAPVGVRVVAVPNSGRPVILPPPAVGRYDGGKGSSVGQFRLPSLASYSDVFAGLMKQKGLVCGSCGGTCESGCYEYTKGDFKICVNCYNNGSCGENKSLDDFEFKEGKGSSASHAALWTEAETQLLLESISKHGDDWDLVAQNVKTKTKLDCILKLIELPFGEFLLGYTNRNGRDQNVDGNANNTSQVQSVTSELPDQTKTEERSNDQIEEIVQNQINDVLNEGPPLKKKRAASLSDGGSSLMKQVSLMSALVGPDITSAATESAVSAICNETFCPREIFYGSMGHISNGSSVPAMNHLGRDIENGDAEMNDEVPLADAQGPLPTRSHMPLQVRAATATALGVVAARAKLLADQEDREIEQKVASIIETQMKKVHDKIKYFEHLGHIMEKEYAEIDDLKGLVVSERISILQKALNAGISRWRDHFSLKPLTGS
ncbi:SWI/SNF complex subunit SWI3A isoform X2 [Syzygium oleosum]|uniref:SWI/SNF complex subunit SWI3A isoform X2 n=1 Tax=Syzygium oleosum TaxID=219896 RepID=UPI0024BB0A7B|nr:SWI/SNF complex subunit SWI3A isoform X2 [Syzygium oleosum]